MNIAHIFAADATALIDRDPRGVAEEYAAEDVETARLVLAEYRAIEAMIQMRAITLPPTRSRQIAIELIPALASMCRTVKAVDMLLRITRDWIDGMGNIRTHAAAVAELRGMGEDCEEARIEVPIAFNAKAVLDVHDARTLAVVLKVHRRAPVIVGMHAIDDEDGERIHTPTPELVA